MDWVALGGIAGIVSLALVVFGGGRYIGKIDALCKRHDVCPIIEVDKKLAVMQARFDMFLGTIETQAPKSLIAPHTPQRDELLRKMTRKELQPVEARVLLSDIENDDNLLKSDKALAAILVIVRLKDMINGELLNVGNNIK